LSLGNKEPSDADTLVLSAINGSNDQGGVRRKLTVFLSRDGGRSWPASKLIHEGPAADSDMAVLEDGTIHCFYEGGVKHRYESIRQASFNREWLVE